MQIITTQSLDSQGNGVKTYNENILNDINKLVTLNDQILSFWNGDDAKTLVRKINDDVIPNLNKLYDCIDLYADYLKRVDNVFESVDDNYNVDIDV